MNHRKQPLLFPSTVPERRPSAVFSECREHDIGCLWEECLGRPYRYQLWWPTGINNTRVALGIFANPSTATAQTKDPTVTRWVTYCRDWGYGWAVVGNVRAWRATDPKDVPADPEAIGPENRTHLLQMLGRAELIVCGWGNLGGAEGPRIMRLIRDAGRVPCALRLTKAGKPCHPLRLPRNLKPFRIDP